MLPLFMDGKDDWAVSLGILLMGRTLDVYPLMPGDAAADDDLLKEALLKCYHLSEDGYSQKFHKARPEKGESPEQLIL